MSRSVLSNAFDSSAIRRLDKKRSMAKSRVPDCDDAIKKIGTHTFEQRVSVNAWRVNLKHVDNVEAIRALDFKVLSVYWNNELHARSTPAWVRRRHNQSEVAPNVQTAENKRQRKQNECGDYFVFCRLFFLEKSHKTAQILHALAQS